MKKNPRTMEELHDEEQQRLESFKGRCNRSRVKTMRNPKKRKSKRRKRSSWACPRRACKVRRGRKSSRKGFGLKSLLVVSGLAAALYFGVAR